MKEFNTTGVCIPKMHYMVDTSKKLDKIIYLIDKGRYFTINRPRQYGKTTTLFLLEKRLQQEGYLAVFLSFEGIGDKVFENEQYFCSEFLKVLSKEFKNHSFAEFLLEHSKIITNLRQLSDVISQLCEKVEEKLVLMIDEVDKSSNNQLFLSFLGMLRNKYLERNMEKDFSFHSIILAGVHDVKTLKLKLRPDDERKFNSPWNIAANFEVKMSFDSEEISTMLAEYSQDKNVQMDIKQISEKLYFYTSGYPFLVSRLCEIIDTKIMKEAVWHTDDIEQAVKILLKERNANFDDLIKNLENNSQLYDMVKDIIIEGIGKTFNTDNPIINLGLVYGIFRDVQYKVGIHNRIYAQRIYNYMSSKLELSAMSSYNFRTNFIENTQLNMEKILLKFQQFMKEKYSEKDQIFLERNGKLLFLAFIKPIINGQGFDFKEVQISEERRLDIVITFMKNKYIIETKIWHGEEANKKGLLQLKDYLDKENLAEGYLVVFDCTKSSVKKFKNETIHVENKEIFAVYV